MRNASVSARVVTTGAASKSRFGSQRQPLLVNPPATGDNVLRKAILRCLNGTNQGNGTGPIIRSPNWGAFTNKLMGLQHAKNHMVTDDEFPEYKRAIRRMIYTIEDEAGWASFKAYIKKLG